MIQTLTNSGLRDSAGTLQPRHRSLFKQPGIFLQKPPEKILGGFIFFLDFCLKICMPIFYGHTDNITAREIQSASADPSSSGQRGVRGRFFSVYQSPGVSGSAGRDLPHALEEGGCVFLVLCGRQFFDATPWGARF